MIPTAFSSCHLPSKLHFGADFDQRNQQVDVQINTNPSGATDTFRRDGEQVGYKVSSKGHLHVLPRPEGLEDGTYYAEPYHAIVAGHHLYLSKGKLTVEKNNTGDIIETTEGNLEHGSGISRAGGGRWILNGKDMGAWMAGEIKDQQIQQMLQKETPGLWAAMEAAASGKSPSAPMHGSPMPSLNRIIKQARDAILGFIGLLTLGLIAVTALFAKEKRPAESQGGRI